MSVHTTPRTINKDSKNKSKNHSQDSIPSFIRKTYDILEERKFPDIIDWNPEGTALVIKKPSEFCQKVLPAYFKHNNLTSFVRQLNMYNFHKRRTQNIDHVYYHELFQKGKKHLLKEIKRKNHEHNSDKLQKPSEALESCNTGKDMSSLMYENQLLKRLYNDAVGKISLLENQVKDLSVQNQSIWTQVGQDGNFKTYFKFDNKSELTQDQLPMTFGEVMIPSLKMSMERQNSMSLQMAKFPSLGNVNCFLNFTTQEETGESTEASHTSPSFQPSMDNEKCFDMTDATPHFSETPSGKTIQLPTITLNPTSSFFQNFQSFKPHEMMVCKKNTSIGQLFENWNFDQNNNNNGEVFTFADQKNDKIVQEPAIPNILGKRPFENVEGSEFQIAEPAMKRDFSLFMKKGITSMGTEDGFFKDFDCNNMDMCDLSQNLFGWTKAA